MKAVKCVVSILRSVLREVGASEAACTHAQLLQSCLTLCDPMDCVARQAPLSMRILQARILECPDTPGSLEGNTEGPGTASSEPLLPS